MNIRQSILRRSVARSCQALALCAPLFCLPATAAGTKGLQPLSDADLSAVRGGDGVSFDLSNFSLSGDARFTYTAPTGASLYLSSLYASRSDDTNQPFADPYTLDLVKSTTGLPDRIEIAFPQNANGQKVWQFAYDWGTNDTSANPNGFAFEGGSVIFKDMVFYGGGLQLAPARVGEGIGFGLALRMDIGNVLLRPRGRDDITVANPSTVTEQLSISGVHLGAVDSTGALLNSPWRIADVETQPGVINAATDDNGKPRFHIAIDWPDSTRAPAGAPLGGLSIDNITFRSDITGNLDLGSSRIGTMQIQYLDIKFRQP